MLAVTRERLLEHLAEVPPLVNLSMKRDPSFPRRVMAWLSDGEGVLLQLRSPLASQLSAERGRLLAVGDGLREQEVVGERLSRLKRERATASLVLSRTEHALRGAVVAVDETLAAAREKMAQLLAVASVDRPIPLPAPDQPRERWLEQVWSDLGAREEVKSMYAYLRAALRPTDRLFLLNELLDNLLNGHDGYDPG